MEDRYYIAIDENGEPYIEHGVLNNVGQRAHKYIAKFGEGANAVYAYTMDQVRAYQTRAQRAAEAARNKQERMQAHMRALQQRGSQALKDVSSKAGNAARTAGQTAKEYGQKAGNAARSAGQQARTMGQNTANAARSAGQQARTTAKNAANTVRSAGQQAGSAARNAVQNAGSGLKNAEERIRGAADDLRENARATVDKVQEKGSSSVEAIKDKATTAMNKADRVREEFRKKKDQTVETIQDKAGVDERERAEEAWAKVPKQLSAKDEKGMEAFREANKAQDEYRKTPLGKAEYLTERAQEIATGVDGSAKDIAKKFGSTVKSKTDRMKEEFRKKKDNAVEKAKDAAIDATTGAARATTDMADKVKDTAEKVADNVAFETKYAVNRAKRAAEDVADTVKNKVGIDAKKNRDQAQKEFETAKRSSDRVYEIAKHREKEASDAWDAGNLDEASEKYKRAGDLAGSSAEMESKAKENLKNAQSEYDKTLLGKGESAVKNAKEQLKNVGEQIKDKAVDISFNTVDAVDKIKDKVSEAKYNRAVKKHPEIKQLERQLTESEKTYKDLEKQKQEYYDAMRTGDAGEMAKVLTSVDIDKIEEDLKEAKDQYYWQQAKLESLLK